VHRSGFFFGGVFLCFLCAEERFRVWSFGDPFFSRNLRWNRYTEFATRVQSFTQILRHFLTIIVLVSFRFVAHSELLSFVFMCLGPVC
jgi:hypothetical protein